MKKLHVSAISILFAALCLAFTACNQGITAEKETGTVHIVIGGGAARSVDAAGLPVFDDTNTKITVTGKDGTKLVEGTTSVTLKLDIGTKITVKAVVTTLTGEWRGSAEHTVTAGTNTVAVKLSKAPNSVGNILIDVVEQNLKYEQVKFKLAGGKELVSQALIAINPRDQEYLVTARDSIGRIYVLYREGSFSSATPHFKRYDTEGKEDNGFEAAITGKLPSGVTLNTIKTMTVDAKTNTIFIVGMDVTGSKHAYAVTEKGHNNFTLSNGFDLTSFIGSGNTIQTAAAYNGTLFFTVPSASSGSSGMENKLIAVKAELSGSSLTLSNKIEMTLPKLRAANAFGNYPTNCTGLFADASGVYCLLKEQNLGSGTLYALGQIVRYQYSGSAFTGETKIGLNPKAAGTDGIPFDAQYFSAPVGFIGSDEDHIYIADDGVNIDTVNENLRVNGNKNRIAAFNRKTNEITFTDTAATWYEQKPEYKYPNTKILLWEKDSASYAGMKYWISDTAGTAFPGDDNALWAARNPIQNEEPTDIFCYDQDGNLYIVSLNSIGNTYVRRFAVKEDGSYDKVSAQNLDLQTSNTIAAIAVDISNGENYLYYADTASSPHTVKRFKWGHSGYETFPTAETEAYSITFSTDKKVTALAANKDGVFVATKEQSTSDDPYTLKIKKYTKDTGASLEEKTIATHEGGDNPTSHPAIDYTNSNGTVCGLQVIEGVLYALRQNIEKKQKYVAIPPGHKTDEFRSSGVIYKVGNTDGSLSDTAMSELGKKEADDASRTGYGFYRFIAVKPKKLVIASDGAWGMDGTLVGFGNAKYQDTDKVLEYDLAGALQHERNSGGSFSKKLGTDGSGFVWQ